MQCLTILHLTINTTKILTMKKNLLILSLMMTTAFAGFSQKKNVTTAILLSKPKKQQYVKAKTYIDKAIKHESTKGQAKTWYYKAFIYAQLSSSKKPKAVELQKTIDFSAEVLAAMKKAKALDKKKEYDRELKNLAAPMYNNSLKGGIAAYNNKEYKKAFSMFTASQEYAKIINLVDSVGAYNGAMAASLTDNYEGAVKNYQRCLDIQYGGADVYLKLADAYTKLEKKDEAAKVMAEAKAKYPNEPAIILNEVKVLLQEKKPEQAKQRLESVLANDPNNFALQYAAGVTYNQMESYDKAIEAYTKALELNPEDYNSKFNLSVVYNNKVVEINTMLAEIPYSETAKYDKEKAARDAFIKEVIPFVEATYAIQKEEGIKRVLNNFYRLTKQKDKMIK